MTISKRLVNCNEVLEEIKQHFTRRLSPDINMMTVRPKPLMVVEICSLTESNLRIDISNCQIIDNQKPQLPNWATCHNIQCYFVSIDIRFRLLASFDKFQKSLDHQLETTCSPIIYDMTLDRPWFISSRTYHTHTINDSLFTPTDATVYFYENITTFTNVSFVADLYDVCCKHLCLESL